MSAVAAPPFSAASRASARAAAPGAARVAIERHRSASSGENIKNARASLASSSRSTAAAMCSTESNPVATKGVSALRLCGKSLARIQPASAFIFPYTAPDFRSADAGIPEPPLAPETAGVFGERFPSVAACSRSAAASTAASWSSAQPGTRSPAARSAAMAKGRQIRRALTSSALRETSIPRISATTRMSMKSSSGIVSIFTRRISGGTTASNGLRCASTRSMRVSNKM